MSCPSEEVLQRLTTVFLSAMDALQQKLPEDFFSSEQPGLMKSWLDGTKILFISPYTKYFPLTAVICFHVRAASYA